MCPQDREHLKRDKKSNTDIDTATVSDDQYATDRCLDCRDQYVVLSRRVDTSYPTGGYGVSVDLSEQPERLATGSMLDTAYGRRVIRRIGNCLYNDKHKKLLDSVLLYKLKLDGEFKLEEEITGEELINRYKAIKEKEDPRVFMLPIHLEGKYNYRSLVDTGSNINMLPYRIYELLERDKVKPKSEKVRMLDHLNAETMERLLNVLCQVRVTTILVNFMLLDVPFDQDIPS
ncbi:MDIS1-interacting receptor like kinase 2-like protein [Tanacetum coccineum]